jgi:putative aldouronate transport system permease protein
MRKHRSMRRLTSDSIMDIVVYTQLILFSGFCIYPVIYVFAIAFSDPAAVKRMEVILWPVGFSVESFRYIIQHEYLLSSYINSIFYTVAGTAYSMLLTILGAFVLSRKQLIGKNVFMFLIWFTMVFSGGLIPLYLQVQHLGLINSRLAMIIPCAVSQYYLIVMRTSMNSIPDALEESAKIDGANDLQVLWNIVLPVCVPTLATIALFYAAGKWNGYFNALIYLSDKTKFPLQLILRELLVTMTDSGTDRGKMSADMIDRFTPLGFKGAVIIVSLVPMMLVYPFIQRYFVKGVMIGAIKG